MSYKHEPEVGSSVQLDFAIESGKISSSVEVKWFKDGKKIRIWSQKYREITTSSFSSLIIHDITIDDTGHYSIMVDDTKSLSIEVSVKG